MEQVFAPLGVEHEPRGFILQIRLRPVTLDRAPFFFFFWLVSEPGRSSQSSSASIIKSTNAAADCESRILPFFFHTNKTYFTNRPIPPRPKHPPATCPARCIGLRLHEPGISSLDLSACTTCPSRVQKIGLHELPFPEEWVWPDSWSPHEPHTQSLPVPTDFNLCRYMS
jgi:hypothetical protein